MFSGGFCGGWGAGGWVVMVGFWLLLIAAAVWAVTRLFPSGGGRDLVPSDEDLDHRLAAGDIDPDEYLRLRGYLVDAGAPTGEGGRS